MTRRRRSVRLAPIRYLMGFDARHIGSGVWGVWDGGVMSWRGTNLGENEAKQRAADLNVMFDQYGNRDAKERREVQPPITVESATWRWQVSWTTGSATASNGGAVYGDQTPGQLVWIKAADLRQAKNND